MVYEKNEKELKNEFPNDFEEFKDEKEIYSPFFAGEEFEKKFNEKKSNSEKKNIRNF